MAEGGRETCGDGEGRTLPGRLETWACQFFRLTSASSALACMRGWPADQIVCTQLTYHFHGM